MAKEIRVHANRRKEIDEEKLAFAFLLLAKILNESEDEALAVAAPVDEEAA